MAANWLLAVGGSVGIPKYDVNDCVSLALPESPNSYVIPCIIFYPLMTYLFVISDAALVGEGFAEDAVW